MFVPILLDVNMTNVIVSVYIKSVFSVRFPYQEIISFVAELREKNKPDQPAAAW